MRLVTQPFVYSSLYASSFFFFEQKTAYEMRISDWSSDVCSSDLVAMPGKRLVDRIVADFEHHVMQARPVVGVADIHARPLAHRVQALENLDRIRAIGALVGLLGAAFGRLVLDRKSVV